MILHAHVDIKIVIGLDQAFNQLVTRAGITQYKDLVGKTLGVDAPDTAFALVAYEMLRTHGISPDQYKTLAVGATSHRLQALKNATIDFSLLTLPFNLLAKDDGLLHLDRPFETIGTYQSTGGFVHASCWRLLSNSGDFHIPGVRHWCRQGVLNLQPVSSVSSLEPAER